MNLPNKLTLFRVILIPFFCFFLLADLGKAGDYIALVLFCVASITDFFDGYLARRDNLVTNFGKFADPLADKLLVGAALICLIPMGRIPAWMVAVIISREFVISGFRLVAAENQIVIAASMWGKAKTFVSMFMIIALILHFGGTVWHIVEQVLIWASLALTVISLADYIWKNRDVLRDETMNN